MYEHISRITTEHLWCISQQKKTPKRKRNKPVGEIETTKINSYPYQINKYTLCIFMYLSLKVEQVYKLVANATNRIIASLSPGKTGLKHQTSESHDPPFHHYGGEAWRLVSQAQGQIWMSTPVHVRHVMPREARSITKFKAMLRILCSCKNVSLWFPAAVLPLPCFSL